MRFLRFLIANFAAATTILASPVALVSLGGSVAGSVVTDEGVSYDMPDTDNWVKAFDQQNKKEGYPHPVTYDIAAGYRCIFYTEASRGVGTPIGEFSGPTSGSFNKWIAFYKCWPIITSMHTRETTFDIEMNPCGFSVDSQFGQQYLRDTGYRPRVLANFAVTGEGYAPERYHVNEWSTCWFYSAHDGRGGSERISTVEGPANGYFTGTPATRYACWHHN